MKVAIDLTALAFNFSGIERYALNITKNLIELDTSNQYCLIFCNEVFKGLKGLTKLSNVSTFVIKSKQNKFSKLYLFQIKLLKEINKMNPDYVLFPAFAAPICLNRINIIDTFHDLGYFDYPKMWKWYVTLYGQIKLRASVKHSRYFVSVSEYTKSRMIEYFHIDRKRIFVATNAVDERFDSSQLPETEANRIREKYNLPEEKFIMCLSTLEPRKNLRLLIDAYSELTYEGKMDKKLVLAGRKGWKVDNLLDSLNNSIRRNIIITGFIDDNDLPGLYKLADTFVFPSLYEGFGIPPLEAIACGTTTIVSDIPIFKESLGDAVNYFINNNKLSLKEKLIKPVQIKKEIMQEQVSKYNWKTSAKVYYDIINKIDNDISN